MKVGLPFGNTPEYKRRPYREALAVVNIEAVEDATTMEGLDGLVLAGGTDIDAALYGAARHPETGEPDCDRDRVEVALLREALERDLPVLAICRGMQMLNVALGGTLAQHIEGHRCPGEANAHGVSIAAGSRLDGILGTAVNSRHHQCVARLADGLLVVGRAPDDVVEAVELVGKHFVVGVQWHPEDRAEDWKLLRRSGRLWGRPLRSRLRSRTDWTCSKGRLRPLSECAS
jgi:putative glutamine amidotransferase